MSDVNVNVQILQLQYMFSWHLGWFDLMHQVHGHECVLSLKPISFPPPSYLLVRYSQVATVVSFYLLISALHLYDGVLKGIETSEQVIMTL